MKSGTVTAAALGLAIVAYAVWRVASVPGEAPPDHRVDVTVPQLSATAEAGALAFETSCAVCHGTNASGGPGGPPLVHKIYEPGHHADGSIALAVRQGVRQHHWQFGDMPPVERVTDDEIAAIVVYVRELQRANGID